MHVNTKGSDQFRGRDLITLRDFDREEIDYILEVAKDLKKDMAQGQMPRTLDRRTLFMMFYNSSLRTRNSFEAGMTQLGGNAHYLEPSTVYAPVLEGEEEAFKSERISDVARVLSQMGEGIAIRIFGDATDWIYGRGNKIIREFAEWSSVPVLNMLDNMYHPHQGLADVMTMKEKFGDLKDKKITVSWAYSESTKKTLSVAHSALIASSFYGMDITLAHPEGFDLDDEVLGDVKKNVNKYGGSFENVYDMDEAVEDADIVYAKSWPVKGAIPPEVEKPDWEKAKRMFEENKDWIINKERMDKTNDGIYMHCLPASRNQEVTDEVMDGPQSVVFDEAGNRLHAQKAVMSLFMR
ncbi:MAG: N-acetylornithine carbamoyltransferase [Thermoplasmatota archaeon]